MFSQKRIVIKGAGDLATGVAARLWRSGFPVMMTEIEQPLTGRRSVSLSDAVYEGEVTVEDMTARREALIPAVGFLNTSSSNLSSTSAISSTVGFFET